MARILVAGRGSYGDMFPMYAIAAALRERGHAVTLATDGVHRGTAGCLGIPLLELDRDAAGEAAPGKRPGLLMRGRFAELLRDLSVTEIDREVDLLLAAAAGADLVVGNQLAYAAALVSRKLGKPWVYCAASPLAMPSRLAPPLFPYLHGLQRLCQGSPALQRSFVAVARSASRLMMQALIRKQRQLGLTEKAHPRFEGIYSRQANLLMASPLLVDAAPDWPRPTVLSGFTWYEPAFWRNAEKLRQLDDFIAAGSPPLVFALGGDRRARPGRFFHESIAAAARLGVRCIVVAADRFHGDLPASASTLVTSYLPYADVFPRVAAVVHSGGIGTIGWSLRHAIPSLLVPGGLDQFDNAWRATRKGYARTLRQRDYAAPKVAAALSGLLEDRGLRQRLASCSAFLHDEDGTSNAVARIEALLP